MASLLSHTTFDSLDAYRQSLFWTEVLGFAEDPDDPNEPGHEECMIFAPDRTSALLFIEVPEAKQLKNRVHFDLRPTDRSREDEVERIVAAGATQVADRRRPDGTGWIVLNDPEGNEFCILSRQSPPPVTR